MNPFLTASVFLLSFQLWASPCGDQLKPGRAHANQDGINLPRELKVTPEAVQFFLSDERSSVLIQALADLLGRLTPAVLRNLANEVTEVPEWKELLDGNPFFIAYPELLDPGVEDNSALLDQLPFDFLLSDYEHGLLCYLLRSFSHQPRPVSVTLTLNSEKRHLSRMKTLLSRQVYREAFSKLLMLAPARASFLGVWNTMDSWGARRERRPNRPLNFQDVNDLRRRLVTNSIKEKDMLPLTNFMEAFIAVELLARDESKAYSAQFSEADLSLTVSRQVLLESTEDYLAQHWQMKSALRDVTEMIDHVLFGTSLPLEPAELYRMIVKAAEGILTPLKLAFAQAKAQSAEPLPQIPPLATEAFTLRMVDRFSPQPERGSHKRQRLVPENDLRPSELRENANPESLVSDDASLRAFTSYSSSPKPIQLLESSQTYQFWFLSESNPVLQQVRFDTDAVRWLKANPDHAKKMLNALHLGDGHGSGVKVLGIRSRRYRGRLFELKAPGPWRGLMVWNRNTWEVVSVVHKDEVNRAAEWLDPLNDQAEEDRR